MLAVDIMTPNPRTIRADDPIQEAIEALQSLDARHLPVVDEQGELVGMLSDRDLRSSAPFLSEGDVAENLALSRQRTRVAERMSTDVVCVDTDADVSVVVEQMIEQRIGAVPVVDGEGQVVGIISYIDVLRAVADVISSLEPPVRPAQEQEQIP